MRLPHDELGTGPSVVLLHAAVADRRMWREQLPAIAHSGHRAVALDLPGFGEAIPRAPAAPWSDVLETLDALGIRTAVLVGNSFGGAVALNAAISAPGRVRALALVSAPPPDLEPSPQLESAWESETTALEAGDLEAATQAVLDAWTLPDAPAEQRQLIEAMQQRAFELQLAAGELEQAEEPLARDPSALETIAIPTLVVYGEHDMPDFRDGAQQLAAAIPGARLEMIAGAGHLAPLERPDEFRSLLLDFLADLGSGGR